MEQLSGNGSMSRNGLQKISTRMSRKSELRKTGMQEGKVEKEQSEVSAGCRIQIGNWLRADDQPDNLQSDQDNKELPAKIIRFTGDHSNGVSGVASLCVRKHHF